MIRETFKGDASEHISNYKHGSRFRHVGYGYNRVYKDYIMLTPDEWSHVKDPTTNIIKSLDPTKEYKVYFISSSFPSLLLNRIKSNNASLNIKRTKSVNNADLIVTDFAYENRYELIKEHCKNFLVKGHSNIDNNASIWYGDNSISHYATTIDTLLQDMKNDSEYCNNIGVYLQANYGLNNDTCEALMDLNKPIISTTDFSMFVIGYLPALKQEDKDGILNMVKSSDYESIILGLQVLSYYNLKEEFVFVKDVLKNTWNTCSTNSIFKYIKYLLNIPERFYTGYSSVNYKELLNYAKLSPLSGEELNRQLLEAAREQLIEEISYGYEYRLNELNIKISFNIDDENGEAVTNSKELGEEQV